MKKTLLTCALALASITAAHAQALPPLSPPQPLPTPNPLRFVASVGVTGGGDTLVSAVYDNGDRVNVKAGSGLQLSAGVDYRVNAQVSLQATVGGHVHFTPEAKNGDVNFTRVPIELLAYFSPAPQWRVGGGARLISYAKLNGSGAAANLDTEFKTTTGAVLEAEYFVSPAFGVKARIVQEKYEPKVGSGEADGKHVGLFANFYF